jgi:polyketide synthase PksN
MKDFLDYVFSEVRSNRLSKNEALGLISQFYKIVPSALVAKPEIAVEQTAPELEQEGALQVHSLPSLPIKGAPARILFDEGWRACPVQSAAVEGGGEAVGTRLDRQQQTLVCFLSDASRRADFAQSLLELSPRTQIIFVGCIGEQGTAGKDATTQGYEVVPGDRQGILDVLCDVQNRHARVDALLYLWPLERDDLIREPMPWVCLVQALAESGLGCRRVVLAGRALNDTAQAYLESWIGAERSIGLALPETRLTVVIEAEFGSDAALDMGVWAQRLSGELGGETQSVLYRDGVRHVCDVHELVETGTAGGSLLRRGGTYLITGGGGGLGLIFAKHLARNYAANLVLTGRSAAGMSIAQQLRELEGLGSQVIYAQADVSDEAAMSAVIERVQQRFGVLNGVIHSAGVASEGVSILQKTVTAFERTLKPKIDGTLVLDRLLQDQPLDFVCYFSSSSAILGDFGSCDYAMGNRFLMAHAQARGRRVLEGQASGKTLAICWPLWEEGGMGFGAQQQTDLYLKSSGQRALDTAQGIEIFEELLRGAATHPLVMIGEPSRLRRILGLGKSRSDERTRRISAARITSEQGKGRRPEMRGFTLPQCIEWDLKEQICRLLKVPREQLDPETNLVEFGFDSIGLTEYAKQLSAYYFIEFMPATFFSYSTLAQLVKYLLTAFGPALEAFYRDGDRRDNERVVSEPKQQRPPSTAPVSAALAAVPTPLVREPIAIIGMSGRFPGARTVEEFWNVLSEGRDLVQEVPPQRFDWRQYHGNPVKEPGKTNCKWLGSLEGVEEFDPLFFEISPREAETMDPRQRLLLQEAWRALEDAGYGREHLEAHTVGMFVGVEQGDYQYLLAASGDSAGVTANHDAVLASRLAYLLDLHGPVIAINTACSSGLVAMHQACQSLRAGECDTAIAAGVNLVLTPQMFIGMAQAGMLSDEGKCRAFSQEANGIVPGEAVVAVVLKRLSQAEAEGDPILAVVQGSGVNYDGKTNGITAPSGVAQTRLLRDVYHLHGIDPGELEYVVAHGTGTRLGDPIEVNALCEAFGEYTSKKQFCALTSTKGNVGHTFATSGLVSLVGLIQAMRHELIPPSLHCQQESDYVRWSDTPFYVNRQARAWPKSTRPRLGALSAFGISGTNAHMVVSSWDADATPADPLPCQLLVLSAKTEQALAERINNMMQLLQSRSWTTQEMHAISHTLLAGRQHFAYRCAIVVEDAQDAIRAWQQASSTQKPPNLFRGQVLRGFKPQRALLDYAQQLLEQTATLINDRERCREHLQALGELYCQGYELPWSLLFEEVRPKRISLPTYPFAKERYWVDAVAQTSAAGSSRPLRVVTNKPTVNDSAFLKRLVSDTRTGAISIDAARDAIIEQHHGGR